MISSALTRASCIRTDKLWSRPSEFVFVFFSLCVGPIGQLMPTVRAHLHDHGRHSTNFMPIHDCKIPVVIIGDRNDISSWSHYCPILIWSHTFNNRSILCDIDWFYNRSIMLNFNFFQNFTVKWNFSQSSPSTKTQKKSKRKERSEEATDRNHTRTAVDLKSSRQLPTTSH